MHPFNALCFHIFNKAVKADEEYMALITNDTPRTNAVYKAAASLNGGSWAVVPENHPACDPWGLSFQLERELNESTVEIERLRARVKLLEDALHILNPRPGEWITPNYEQAARISAALEETK